MGDVVSQALGSVGADELAFVPKENSLKRVAWRARQKEQDKRRKAEGPDDTPLNIQSLSSLVLPEVLKRVDGELSNPQYAMLTSQPFPGWSVVFSR